MLLIDEAQEMTSSALSELRLLSSVELIPAPSSPLFWPIFAWLAAKGQPLTHRQPHYQQMHTEALAPSQLLQCVNHLLKKIASVMQSS